MLSGANPAFSSPPPELPFPYARPTLAGRAPPRAPSTQIAALDGYVSPREVDKRVAPSRPAPQQSPYPPHPSLSPLSEYHSGFSDAELGSRSSTANHRRQQSFPNLLPAAFRSRTPSPVRKQTRLQEPMPLTGDGRPGARVDSPKGGIASWFGAGAAPRDDESAADTTPTKLRRNTGASVDPTTPKSSVTTTASRFMSALSSRFASTPVSPIIDDELCNLNVEAALFPPSSPNSPNGDRDTFSPAAFKNLQMNAVGLLNRMQSAYRDRVATVKELQAEKLAQREEMEEAETRARHLKMQLEGMARKAQEQEREMKLLMEELAAERRARVEMEKCLSEGSMISEDLGVDEERRRRKWVRKSGETVKSEASFDTDDESAESESVFSRCRSPTLTIGEAMDGTATPQHQQVLHVRNSSSIGLPGRPRTQPQKEMTAFQKIIKGIAGDAEEQAVNECRNCKGQDASVAWDTVGLLRDENRHLKQRVGELEVAVEGALDLVNGIGLRC
ncbi:hypothetical protein QBC47DRAFT_178528 [Echria macrotheca]|uniref:Uncharacterized protein n=1 Tax=Echria macrotheca TaxID=438768 RepID=A0AAJ0BDH9_9PEZI|nr:hypothetical protein QBC47DRAFT_178528 [Echria macrotheca]